MKLNLRRQVDTRITIVAIVIVLVIVQAAWWKGLVFRPKPPMRRGGGGGGGGGAPEFIINGRADVYVETIAGSSEPGDADGIGRNARFDGPVGLAMAADGSVIVADSRNNRIRRMSNGKVETIAGSIAGYADGPAASAQFSLPSGVAVLSDGSILVADTGNNRIRAIRDGQVTTIAGGEAGNVDGVAKTAQFRGPVSISGSNVASTFTVADALNHKLRKMATGGAKESQQLPGTPTGVADINGAIIAVPDKGVVIENGTQKTIKVGSSNITLKKPLAVCPSRAGYYISSAEHGALFEVQNGSAEVVAGACMENQSLMAIRDGIGSRAGFGAIAGIAFDGKGHIYVSDTSNNAIRRITLPEAGDKRGREGAF